MQAMILAAGMGKRLGELTAPNAKCMVKVNGVTLIQRMLRQFHRKGHPALEDNLFIEHSDGIGRRDTQITKNGLRLLLDLRFNARI